MIVMIAAVMVSHDMYRGTVSAPSFSVLTAVNRGVPIWEI